MHQGIEMYWLLVAVRRFWAGDSRPEARRITLGCGIVVVFVVVMLAVLRMGSWVG